MKKIAIFAALASLCGSVFAQTNVSIYGVVDNFVEHLTNMPVAGGGSGSVTRLTPSGEWGSRLGFKGVEDLGGGNKVFFTLENGLNTDTGAGTNPALAFSRLAFVGLSSSYGQVAFGRQYTAMFDIIAPYFPQTRAPAYEPYAPVISIYTDNTVKYSYQNGPIKFAAHYGFGEQAGSTKAASSFSVGASYNSGSFSAATAYDQTNTLASATGGIGENRRLALVAKYTFAKDTTVFGGYKRGLVTNNADVRTLQENIWWTGVKHQWTPAFDTVLGYYYRDLQGASAAGQSNPKQIAVHATYYLSKRTNLYAVAAHAKNSALNFGALSTLGTGENSQTGIAVGVRHLF